MHNTCIKILVEFQVETDKSLSYMYYQVSVNIKYKQNESLRVTDMTKQFFFVIKIDFSSCEWNVSCLHSSGCL